MIRLFASHPTAAFLLALAMVAAGLMSLPGLQRDTFPDYRADRIEIRIVYPGAAAEEVEEAICFRLEEAVDGVSGIAEFTCTARRNVAVAHVEIVHGYDLARLLTELKTEVDAIDSFPSEVEAAVVRQLEVTDPVVSLALSGPMSTPDLRTLAEEIKVRLRQVAGVAEVNVHGFSERQLEVRLDEHRLRALGLSAQAVAAAIGRQSLDLPAGTIETGESDILVRFADRRRSPRELEDLVLRDVPGAGTIRLGDVAGVVETFVDDEVKTLFNDARAAVIEVRRDKADDALRVLEEVEAFVEGEQQRLPASVTLELTKDSSSLIADRLRMLAINALQGFALICLVLWTLFSARFSLAVAAALPLSLLASVFVLDAIGYNLNLLSTVGLLIAVGLLIDSAIVINENIARHSARGAGTVEAATEGTREVAGGVISSFLTSVAVFAPLAFLEGDIGRVLLVVPVVLIIVLTASLVVSFLVLPFFAARALAQPQANRIRLAVDRWFDIFRERVVGGAVRLAISWRYLTVGLAGLAFFAAISLVAGGTLKFQAFPDIEGDVIEARLMMTPGTPLARMEAAVDRVGAALERVEEAAGPANSDCRPLVENVMVEFSRNGDIADQGPHLAAVRADLLGSELRSLTADEVLQAWRRETGLLPDVVSLTFKEPFVGPAGQPIEVRLSGRDLDMLHRASRDLLALLARYDGVIDLTTDLHRGGPELRLRLREGAGRLGIDAATVASQIRGAFQGITADEIQAGSEAVRIDVRHGGDWRQSLGHLDDFVIRLEDGRGVPLFAVVEIEQARGMALIPRVDGRRTATVIGDVDTARANANEVLAAVEETFGGMLAERYPGVDMAFEGQAAAQAETGASVRRSFLVGIVAMFIVLSFQFRSYVESLIVMLAIPLALTGVVAGHWLMGIELSMPSMVGFVSLAGIVVNNSILLVVFIKMHVANGSPLTEAARSASLDRFRAIFMTSATTVAGLVPLLFETSVQAQVLVPLVTSLAFGLVAATVLVLFLVPALYVILDDVRRRDAASPKLSAVSPGAAH